MSVPATKVVAPLKGDVETFLRAISSNHCPGCISSKKILKDSITTFTTAATSTGSLVQNPVAYSACRCFGFLFCEKKYIFTIDDDCFQASTSKFFSVQVSFFDEHNIRYFHGHNMRIIMLEGIKEKAKVDEAASEISAPIQACM